VIDLDQQRPDLYLLPGDRLQDRQLGSLDVQAEEVDGGIPQRLQDAEVKMFPEFYILVQWFPHRRVIDECTFL